MSLLNFVKKEFNDRVESSNALAELSTISVLQYTDNKEVFKELYKDFNPYDLELTISPKTSTMLQSMECATCGRASLNALDEQEMLMRTLITNLVLKYKINVLGCFELYNDKVNLHCHMIINNVNDNKRRKIKQYIREYYKLFNNNVVNLKDIISYDKYRDYLIKDNYGDFFYATFNKTRTIQQIEKELLEKEEKEIEKHKLWEESISNDPIQWHKYTCEFTDCPICRWIGQCENVSESHPDQDHFYNECV